MRSSVVAVLFAFGTGCVVRHDDGSQDGPQDGQVEVNWLVGSAGCEASGVTAVEVTLGSSSQTFDCEADGGVLTVPSGTYDVVLQGLDAESVPRYGGDGGTVTVYGGQTTSVPTVVLSSLPASLTVNWRFDNGYLCASNDVQDVEVNLFDEHDVLQGTIQTPCDDGVATLSDMEAGDYDLLVLGRDETGHQNWSARQPVSLLQGDEASVSVSLVAE